MRKLLSILLLAVLALPFAAPLLAQDFADESKLPACCRRHGKHHCMGDMAGMAADGTGEVTHTAVMHALPERCPYCVTSAAAWHPDPSAAILRNVLFTGIRTQSYIQAQAESVRRIAQVRARHKRGPPTLFL